jgi:hypothetical protein
MMWGHLRVPLRWHERYDDERQRQQEFRVRPYLGIDLRVRGDLRQDRHRKQREEVDQHHEIAPPLPARMLLVHLAPNQAGQHHDPEGEKPPVEPQHHARGDQREDEPLRCRDVLLGAQERLPQQEQPEVREQQRPRPRVAHAPKHRDVQERQHRHQDNAPVALAEAPCRVGEPRRQRRRQRPRLHEDFSATSLQKTPVARPVVLARSVVA